MSGDKYDWLKRTSNFSRIVNPELHAKPNLTVGAIGTGVFVFVVGNLLIKDRWKIPGVLGVCTDDVFLKLKRRFDRAGVLILRDRFVSRPERSIC